MAKKKAKGKVSKVKKKAVKKTAKTTSKEISFEKILSQNAQVLSRSQGENTAIVLNLENDDCFFKLTDACAEFWNGIDGRSSIKQISQKIIDKHGVSEAQFHKNLKGLLKSLVEYNLVDIKK